MTWTAKQLGEDPANSIQSQLPGHLKSIVDLAKQKISPTRIWLFGSRARGDANERSDYDIAFRFTGSGDQWVDFVNTIEESPPSLYKYDLIAIDQAGDPLKKVIEKEGIIIYG